MKNKPKPPFDSKPPSSGTRKEKRKAYALEHGLVGKKPERPRKRFVDLEKRRPGKTTAWSDGAKWYDEQHGSKGSYYHDKIIIPGALRMLKIGENSDAKILDFGCGQGVFARALPSRCSYVGVDLSKELLERAKKYDYPCNVEFLLSDASKYSCKPGNFSIALSILSLQNMEHPKKVVENGKKALPKGGRWLVVINHPCFRVPKHSSWETDSQREVQYRRIDQYMTPESTSMKIHPSLGEKSPITWNYHHSLSETLSWFFKEGFVLTQMEEWCSDKKSEGKTWAQEDRARGEFPLFMALLFELTH